MSPRWLFLVVLFVIQGCSSSGVLFEAKGLEVLDKDDFDRLPKSIEESDFQYVCRNRETKETAIYYGTEIDPEIYKSDAYYILNNASETHTGKVVVFSEQQPPILIDDLRLGIVRNPESLPPPTSFFYNLSGQHNGEKEDNWYAMLGQQAGAKYGGEIYTWSDVVSQYVDPSPFKFSSYKPTSDEENVLIEEDTKEGAPWWTACFYINADDPIKNSFERYKDTLEIGSPKSN